MVYSDSTRNDVKCGADLSFSRDFFVSYTILYLELGIP